MSFGKNKQTNSLNKKASTTVKPVATSSPLGTLANGQYKPNLPGMQSNINASNAAAGQVLGNLPTNFSLNDFYNNPFYQNTLDMYQAPINRQYQQDLNTLNSDLNAKGQSGSSYDALEHNFLNQNHDYNLNMAQNQAREAAANAYGTSINTGLQTLAGLGNYNSQALQSFYTPANFGINYQQAVSPLQQTMANIYGQQANTITGRPTLGMQLWDTGRAFLGAGGQAAGAYFGAG